MSEISNSGKAQKISLDINGGKYASNPDGIELTLVQTHGILKARVNFAS